MPAETGPRKRTPGAGVTSDRSPDHANKAPTTRGPSNTSRSLVGNKIARLSLPLACLIVTLIVLRAMPVLLDLARPHFKRLCTGSHCLGSSAQGRAPIAAPAAARAPTAAGSRSPDTPPRGAHQQPPQQQHKRGSATATRAFSGGAGAMPLTYRPPIVVRPSGKHTGTVIMLRECTPVARLPLMHVGIGLLPELQLGRAASAYFRL